MVETLPVDMLPGTLPNKRDVLAETKYDSKYLAGTDYIIENAQPGNANFNEIVAAKLCRLWFELGIEASIDVGYYRLGRTRHGTIPYTK